MATGLDSNSNHSTYYGNPTLHPSNNNNNSSLDENDENLTNQQDNLTSKTDLSNQYHMYDSAGGGVAGSGCNKSSVKFYSDNPISADETEDDDDDDTTTDDITDDTAVTKQNLNRFIIKKHSPTELSIRTQDTYAETMPSIQPRSIIKSNHISPPTKQSTPNLNNNKAQLVKSNYNPISYDKIMNLTSADEDDLEVNSRRLLTNKVNTSNNNSNLISKPSAINQ